MAEDEKFNMDDFIAGLNEQELHLEDSPVVLAAVFNELEKKKKKRRFFFILFFGLGLLLAGTFASLYFLTGSSSSTGSYTDVMYPECAYTKLGQHKKVIVNETGYYINGRDTVKTEDIFTEAPLKKYTGTGKYNNQYSSAAVDQKHTSHTKNKNQGKEQKSPTKDTTTYRDKDIYANTNEQVINLEEQGRTEVTTLGEDVFSGQKTQDTGIVIFPSNPALIKSHIPLPASTFVVNPKSSHKENKTKFTLGITSSLLFTSFNVTPFITDSSFSAIMLGYVKEKTEKENSFNPGMDLGLNFRVIHSKFVFETGFRYVRQAFIQDFTQPGNLFPSPFTNTKFVSRIDYLELPLLLGANFTIRRFSIKPIAGVHIGVMLREQFYQWMEGTELMVYSAPVDPIFTMNIYVKAEVSYRFHQHFSAGIAPVFLYNLTSAQKQPFSYSLYSWSLGVQGGVFYHF